jgi:hypothetical protein
MVLGNGLMNKKQGKILTIKLRSNQEMPNDYNLE